jgi:hypothetical protein
MLIPIIVGISCALLAVLILRLLIHLTLAFCFLSPVFSQALPCLGVFRELQKAHRFFFYIWLDG